MRYDIRWANGTWIIFDLREYRACEAFDTFKAAERKFNAPVDTSVVRKALNNQRGSKA